MTSASRASRREGRVNKNECALRLKNATKKQYTAGRAVKTGSHARGGAQVVGGGSKGDLYNRGMRPFICLLYLVHSQTKHQ